MSVAAFPLAWPKGWPRTREAARLDSKYRFKRPARGVWTFADARDELSRELDLMRAGGVILSSNYELRLDGLPRANGPTPRDTGIAVYFTLKGRPKVMACDMHLRGEENMRSVALALDAMRSLERHGGGVMMDRAFEGFDALPAPGSSATLHWWQTLGLVRSATIEQINAAFRKLAQERHPDKPGGSAAAMAELNAARDQAIAEKS